MNEALKETVYTPESPLRRPGQLLAEMVSDLAKSRELAWRLFVRDLSAQYRQSALGYCWAFVMPIVAALPWLYLSSQNLLNTGETPIPYVAYVLAGTTLWAAFTDSLSAPLNALNSGRAMMSKISFPREALVIGGLANLLFNLMIRLSVLLVAFVFLGVPFGALLLLAPVGLAAIILAGLSLGLLLAPIGMLYTDVGRAIVLVSSLWMVLTPVVYAPPTDGVAGWLAQWNPASPLILTGRDFLTNQPPAELFAFVLVTTGSVVLLLFGWVFLRLSLPIIVERMGG